MVEPLPAQLTTRARASFRGELKAARMAALEDAEDSADLVFVFERLGHFLNPTGKSLGDFTDDLAGVAERAEVPALSRALQTPASVLCKLVRDERNAAMHVGARGRALVEHAIELSLLLEDALAGDDVQVSDFMVRNVIAFDGWEPTSRVRQQMLKHQFSAMPFRVKEGDPPRDAWYFIRDVDLARWLNSNREEKAARSIEVAVRPPDRLPIVKAIVVAPSATRSQVLKRLAEEKDPGRQGTPALVMEGFNLLGIVTAHDLL